MITYLNLAHEVLLNINHVQKRKTKLTVLPTSVAVCVQGIHNLCGHQIVSLFCPKWDNFWVSNFIIFVSRGCGFPATGVHEVVYSLQREAPGGCVFPATVPVLQKLPNPGPVLFGDQKVTQFGTPKVISFGGQKWFSLRAKSVSIWETIWPPRGCVSPATHTATDVGMCPSSSQSVWACCYEPVER